jgi:hypothetical protein
LELLKTCRCFQLAPEYGLERPEQAMPISRPLIRQLLIRLHRRRVGLKNHALRGAPGVRSAGTVSVMVAALGRIRVGGRYFGNASAQL